MALASRPRAGDATPGHRRRVTVWQMVCAAPAMISSLLLLLVLLAGLGRWELPALFAWLAAAAALYTRPGERLAVRIACRFRRSGPADVAALTPVWTAALRHAAVAVAEVDLYVYQAPQPNAATVGRRSIALSSGILEAQRAGRLTAEELVAVLVHELGHIVTGATRWALPVAWLAAPARLVMRLLSRVACALAGRQPRPLLALLLTAQVLVAVVQAIDRGQWLLAGVLAGVAMATVLTPLAHAVVSRRSEFAADGFAADHGLASPLASALRTLAGDPPLAGQPRDLLASHPALGQRIDALQPGGPASRQAALR
jgi:STE24 endopeptidase